MSMTFRDGFLGAVILLGLGVTATGQGQPAPPPLSAEAQELIAKLKTLRVPETISFLKTVDPKVFAEAVKSPEGGCAMIIACRWSTRRPDTQTTEGRIAVEEFVQKLARKFALLPRSILDPLAIWRATRSCDLDIPHEEVEQILDTQDAVRAGCFLARLTPEQREATYELQELWKSMEKRQAGVVQAIKEAYALFTSWGPEKLRHVLEGEWSAGEFLKVFYLIYLGQCDPKHQKWDWNLSAMPSWFWEELARFAEGPNAYPALSLFPNDSPASPGSFSIQALNVLSDNLKDERMSKAMDVVSERFYRSYLGK